MAHLFNLLVIFGLAATAHALEPLLNYGRSLEESSCQSLVPHGLTPLKPTRTHFPVFDLEWVGADDQTVYAITSDLVSAKGGLWRSRSGGETFEELTAKLTGDSSQALGIIGIHAQKSNANNILILGAGTSMWISNDKGETMSKLEYPGGVKGVFFRDARFNPRRDNWLLVHVKRAACKVMDKAHMECPRDLMLNKDAFNPSSPWLNLTTNSNGAIAGFVDFDWGANLCPTGNCTGLPPISDELILATAYARAEDYDQPWDKDVSFLASETNFATFTTRMRCGNQLEVVGHSVYMALANSCPESPDGSSLPSSPHSGGADSITLFTSMDGGVSFTRACLPAALKQDGYELVETHDGRGALVIVDFSVDSGMMMPVYAASVYTAGPHHALFSLSLTNVFQGSGGATTDFVRLEGLPGIYIANQVVPYPSSDGSAGSTDPTLPTGDMGDAGYSDYYDPYYDLGGLVGPPLIETRITYSAGGRWQRIRAPSSTSHPECACVGPGPCFLHLNGMSATSGLGLALPGVYSSPSAPGLVLATGNLASLGSGLDQQSPGVCTWLSRDGGMSWEDVAVGPYIYEFADWGGVVVMARYPGADRYAAKGLTQEVLFSLDYGRCWQSVPLEVPLFVDNIRVEPDGQRPVVILHGEAQRNASAGINGTEGLMYAVNVRGMTGWPECNPASGLDFESWSPNNVNGTARCVLGQRLSLSRRKQDSKCFYGPNYKRPEPLVTATCNCTKQLDTECDYGYVRANDSCVLIPGQSMPQCPVVEQGKYTVSEKGLRRVHGDQCMDTSLIIPDTDGQGKSTDSNSSEGGKRTSSTSGSSWVVGLVVGLVAVVVVGGGWAWWRYRATDEQQESVREVVGSAGAAVAGVWGLLVDKIRSIRFRSSGAAGGGGGSGEEMGYFQPLGDPGYDVEGRGNIFTLK